MPRPHPPAVTPRILAIGTAVPRHVAEQATITDFFVRAYEANLPSPERERAVRSLRFISARSGISQRHSTIADYGSRGPDGHDFFPGNAALQPFPRTAARMARFEEDAVALAAESCGRALERGGVGPGAVTHLVTVTCTGFFAPGPDIRLMQRLGLRPDVQRTLVGFMGCHGGFNGLRTAAQIVAADPAAVVLVTCVELCTLHFQISTVPDHIVANTIFADGACALLLGAADRHPHGGVADLRATASHVDGDSLDQMSWRIGDTGFEMTLSSDVPRTLHGAAPAFVDRLLDGSRWSRADVVQRGLWSIHPGGTRIVDAIVDSLALPDGAAASARHVLDRYGNMSSATLGFLLARDLQSAPAGTPGVALGFGPGLTIEGALLEAV